MAGEFIIDKCYDKCTGKKKSAHTNDIGLWAMKIQAKKTRI